jgi:hypothetical protein
MTAVAEEWQRWRTCELEVVRTAKEVVIAVRACKEAEECCEAALTDVEIDAAEDDLDKAEARLDAAESSLEDAEDEADEVRVRLRAAEQRAVWAGAVRVVAHLRAGRRAAQAVVAGALLVESAKKQRGSTLSEVVVQSAVAQSVPSAVEMAAGPELRGEEQDCVVPALVCDGDVALVLVGFMGAKSTVPVEVLPTCLGALSHRRGWRHRCCGVGRGRIAAGDGGGSWRQFDPGGGGKSRLRRVCEVLLCGAHATGRKEEGRRRLSWEDVNRVQSMTAP